MATNGNGHGSTNGTGNPIPHDSLDPVTGAGQPDNLVVNGGPYELTVESCPTNVYAGENFSVRLWVDYPDDHEVVVSAIRCQRLPLAWYGPPYDETRPLVGPETGVVRNGHAITFEGLRFLPRAVDDTWQIKFRLFVGAMSEGDAWFWVRVRARPE